MEDRQRQSKYRQSKLEKDAPAFRSRVAENQRQCRARKRSKEETEESKDTSVQALRLILEGQHKEQKGIHESNVAIMQTEASECQGLLESYLKRKMPNGYK